MCTSTKKVFMRRMVNRAASTAKCAAPGPQTKVTNFSLDIFPYGNVMSRSWPGLQPPPTPSTLLPSRAAADSPISPR